MRIIVTGGSGFLGGFVIPKLIDEGHEVLALARTARACATVTELGAVAVPGDLDVPVTVDQAFNAAKATGLVNLASLGFGHAPVVVGAAEDSGISRAIFISTTAIFTSIPAPSKTVRTAAEEAIVQSNLRWTILRPTMIYGSPRDRNMWRLLRLLRRSPIVLVPGARSLQQPVHVDDLAQAVVASISQDRTVGMAITIAGPRPITFGQVIADASAAVARRPMRVPFPAGALTTAIAFCDRSGLRLPIKAEQVARLRENKAFDISDAVELLGYRPREFLVGITQEAGALDGHRA